MQWLLIVHSAPTSLPAQAAQQLCATALADGIAVSVFFHADGVYHALPVTAMDPSLLALHDAYGESANTQQDSTGQALQLLVCRASLSRRSGHKLSLPWQSSGLVQLAELLQQSDRVISFVD